MRTNFAPSLRLVLAIEGGYVDDPDDPGGATNQGVTQAAYDRWRRTQALPTRPVRQLEPAERDAIYDADYWQLVAGDRLPVGVDYSTFDAGVNSGPAQGAKWLQRALGVEADGLVGPETLAAVTAAPDKASVITRMCGYRLSFLEALKTWWKYGKGWTARVAGVEAAAIAMMVGAGLVPARKPVEMAAEADRRAKGQAAGAAASGGGAAGTTQIEPGHLDPITPWLIGGGVVVLIVVAAVLVWRARVNQTRAAALKAVAT